MILLLLVLIAILYLVRVIDTSRAKKYMHENLDLQHETAKSKMKLLSANTLIIALYAHRNCTHGKENCVCKQNLFIAESMHKMHIDDLPKEEKAKFKYNYR